MNKRLLILGITLTCIITVCLTGCTSGGAEKITPSNPLIIDMSPEGSDDTAPAVTPPPSEQAVTESSIRTALQKLSGTGVVSADCITKIEVSSTLGRTIPMISLSMFIFNPMLSGMRKI